MKFLIKKIKMDFLIKKSKKLLILTVLFLTMTVLKIKSQVMPLDTYDACAYVGASNQENLTDFCLDSDPNCCYFTFEWVTATEEYVYYACVNKKRLIKSVGGKNMTAAFIDNSSDEVFPILRNIVYVQCADNSDVIVSPTKMVQPSLNTYQRRRILTYKSWEDFVDDNDEEVYWFKKIYNKVSKFFSVWTGEIVSYLSNSVKYIIKW